MTESRRRQSQDGQWQELADDGYWYPVEAVQVHAQSGGSANTSVPVGAWMAVISGALMALGSLLPWWSATAAFGISINRNGFQLGNHEGFSIDGVIAIVLGIVTIVIGIGRLTNSRPPSFLQRSAIITGCAGILLCVIDYSSINSSANDVINVTHGAASASVSYGFWLVGVGAAIAIVSGLILHGNSPHADSSLNASTGVVAQPGYYPDPGGSGLSRYWDGDKWTDVTTGDPSTMEKPPGYQ